MDRRNERSLHGRVCFIVGDSQIQPRRKFGARLLRSGSGFARKTGRVGGMEFGHVTHNLTRLFFVDA
jgi:hypothetical protein